MALLSLTCLHNYSTGFNVDVDTTSKVEQLNLRTNTWEKMEDLPCKRSALSSGLISFKKLGEEARNTLRLVMPDIMSDDAEMME